MPVKRPAVTPIFCPGHTDSPGHHVSRGKGTKRWQRMEGNLKTGTPHGFTRRIGTRLTFISLSVAS